MPVLSISDQTRVQDAHVYSGNTTGNYGADNDMYTGYSTARYKSFLRFDLADIPANQSIISATLKLYVKAKVGSGQIFFRKALATWNEGAITWGNMPSVDAANAATLAPASYSSSTTVSLDITALVQQWYSNPANNFGLALIHELEGSGSNNYTIFATSEETTTAWRPVLEITYEPLNSTPTLTLSSPADNQVLSEGSNYPIEGSATEADNGNVVTIKYKINDGTTRAIASGVSDGSTPLSFARTLTYHDKRLWDGSTDVVGTDLAEGVDHILTVWAEDDHGGKSAEVTRNFRVIHNRPPVISGENEDLGTIMTPPSRTYTVTDPESNPFTVIEKINGTVIRTFPGVAGQEETITIPHDLWIRLDLDTPHSLIVEATDSNGLTSTRMFTFVRTETHIEFMLDFDNPAVAAHFTTDGMPERVLFMLERYLPPGSEIESVLVTNNYLDAQPTWEDATVAVSNRRGYLFTNTSKTAENWAICVWVTIAKGTATQRVHVDGYGGAFD